MPRLDIPTELSNKYIDFHWNQQKLWSLNLRPQRLSIERFSWLLNFPVWIDNKTSMPFKVTPRMVIQNPGAYKLHYERMVNAEISFPVHVCLRNKRWQILDGIHRLSKLVFIDGKNTVDAYVLKKEHISFIKLDSLENYSIKY